MSDLKLGQIITTPQNRDAIHVAVAPVKAGENLAVGQRVRLVNNIAVPEFEDNTAIGIVDPFLPSQVRVGQMFWLFLFPGTITALRHEWTHPAFEQKANHESVLKQIASRIGCSFEGLLQRLDVYARGSCCDDDFIYEGLNQLKDELIISQMWDAYEEYRMKKVDPEIKTSTYFSCAC